MEPNSKQPSADQTQVPTPERVESEPQVQPVREIGGPQGPEPTRYGDWERKGRCIDF